MCHQYARFVHCNYIDRTSAFVTNMVKSFGWGPFNTDSTSAMLFRIRYGLVDIHTHIAHSNDSRTRGSQRLRQLPTSKDVYKYLFCPRTISDWNRLPVSITTQGNPISRYRRLRDFGGKQMMSSSDSVCTYPLLMIKIVFLEDKQRNLYFLS